MPVGWVVWQPILIEYGLDCPECMLPSGMRFDLTKHEGAAMELVSFARCRRCGAPL